MLARELKTRFKKKTNEFIFFIQAQTIKGNSYTCQITNEEDMDRFKEFCSILKPLILADNQFPQLPFENDSLIVGIKFSEGKDKETQELIELVQFTLNYHVDDKSENGKTIPNTIKIPLVNRSYTELPDQMVRTIKNLQEFLSLIAEKACKNEYHQENIFDNDDYKVEIKTYSSSPFDEVEKATQEITGSAAPQEQIEGMKAATEEHLNKRNGKKWSIHIEDGQFSESWETDIMNYKEGDIIYEQCPFGEKDFAKGYVLSIDSKNKHVFCIGNTDGDNPFPTNMEEHKLMQQEYHLATGVPIQIAENNKI